MRYNKNMKSSGKYNNGQVVSEQTGDVLTYYHINGKIKAQGKCIDAYSRENGSSIKKKGIFGVLVISKTVKNTENWDRGFLLSANQIHEILSI